MRIVPEFFNGTHSFCYTSLISFVFRKRQSKQHFYSIIFSRKEEKSKFLFVSPFLSKFVLLCFFLFLYSFEPTTVCVVYCGNFPSYFSHLVLHSTILSSFSLLFLLLLFLSLSISLSHSPIFAFVVQSALFVFEMKQARTNKNNNNKTLLTILSDICVVPIIYNM